MTSQKDFFINGTNRSLGTVIDMTVYATDFIVPGVSYFFICPETAAPIETMLADGSLFTITAVQASAYLGRWYPVALIKVIKIGSTGKFSFGY
jgi:hypothetical protein